jgi:uncharacterized damage-inducible protein DinB
MTSIELLLAQIDQAYDRSSWHGTNLRGSVRGLAPDVAAWRPGERRHNIHELVVHCAYWKYTVTRRLTGGKRNSFALKGSNWFVRGEADAPLWKADLALLEDCHRQLRATIAALAPKALLSASGNRPVHQVVSGIVAHDLYHAGQIQLVKTLYATRSAERGTQN